jgi:hypothetical protein
MTHRIIKYICQLMQTNKITIKKNTNRTSRTTTYVAARRYKRCGTQEREKREHLDYDCDTDNVLKLPKPI